MKMILMVMLAVFSVSSFAATDAQIDSLHQTLNKAERRLKKALGDIEDARYQLDELRRGQQAMCTCNVQIYTIEVKGNIKGRGRNENLARQDIVDQCTAQGGNFASCNANAFGRGARCMDENGNACQK